MRSFLHRDYAGYWYFGVVSALYVSFPSCSVHVTLLILKALTTLERWFNRRRDTVMGIAFTRASLGGVIFPIMVRCLSREVSFG